MTLTVQKIIVLSCIGLILLLGNVLAVANWLTEKGVVDKANWVRQEFLNWDGDRRDRRSADPARKPEERQGGCVQKGARSATKGFLAIPGIAVSAGARLLRRRVRVQAYYYNQTPTTYVRYLANMRYLPICKSLQVLYL